jgi:hypothetical protein
MNRKRVQTLMRLMGIAALAGHSSRARLSLSRRGHRLGVESAPCVVGRRSKRPSRRSAGRRYSTSTEARNSRPPPSPARSKKPASPSPWAAAAAGWTMFIERLWRSMKYEGVYLKGYADSHEGRARNRQVGYGCPPSIPI